MKEANSEYEIPIIIDQGSVYLENKMKEENEEYYEIIRPLVNNAIYLVRTCKCKLK
jgi:hypothetical protein